MTQKIGFDAAMDEKLHAIWPVLALDGVGDAIGDARPIFVVSRDGRFLHFANAGGARFLHIAPARALDARLTLEPRLAERLARFAAAAKTGDAARELLRFFDGLRSSLLSVGFRRLADDAVLVTVDNARTDPADADPAASLAAIAAEGGLVALFDAADEVICALGDHAVLDGVQDEIETALDTDGGDAVFAERVQAGDRVHDLALVRLGSAPHARRLLRVGPARAAESISAPATAAPAATSAETPALPVAPAAARAAEPIPAPAPASVEAAAEAPPVAEAPALAGHTPAPPALAPASMVPEIPAAEVPPLPVAPDALTEDLARAVDAATAPLAPGHGRPAPLAAPTAAMPAAAEVEPDVAALAVAHGPATIAAVAAEATRAHVPPSTLAERPVTAEIASEIEASAASAEPTGAHGSSATPATLAETIAEAAPSETIAATIAAPAPAAETEVAEAIAAAPRRPLAGSTKFVWQMDADRRFTLISDEFATAVGPRAAEVVGATWADVAGRFGLDPEGRVATALERRDTWSGRTVLWPVEGEALRVPVDLAALPAFDRGRVFTGYRGFGTVRGDEAIPDPTAAGLRLVAATTATEAPAAALAIPPVAEPDAAPAGLLPDIETPPSFPDDSEVALVEEHHPNPVEATLDGGEAAFAGEIEPVTEPAPARTAEAVALPDLWLDDELALAMATLPACAEGDETTEAESEPADDDAVAASVADLEAPVPGEPPEPAAPPAPAPLAPTSPLALDAAERALAEREADTDTPPPAAAVAAPEIGHREARVIDAPAELRAAIEEIRARAAELEQPLDHPAETADAAHDRAARLARAPEALRSAVAEIEARAAELEPHRPGEPPVAMRADTVTAVERAAVAAAEAAHPSEAEAPAHPVDAAAPPAEPPTRLVATPSPLAEITAPSADDVATAVDAAVATVAPAAHAETPPPAALVESSSPAGLVEAAPAVAPEKTEPDAAAPTPAAPPAGTSAEIVALTAATRPPLDAARLSQPERVAFRQIAEALGARIEGEDHRPGTDAAAPSPAVGADTAARPREASGAIETRLLDRLPAAVAIVKDEGLVYGNDAFLRLLGYPDLATLEAEGGLDALFAGEHVARRWKAGPDGGRPVPVLARDGRVVPVDAEVSTVPWGNGSALMMTLSEADVGDTAETAEPAAALAATPAAPAPTTVAPPAADLTASLADAGLRGRIGELEAIVDTATDGVLLLDAEGTILSANHGAEALFGADRRALIGKPLADRLAPESRRSAMDYLDGLARNGVASVLNDGREVIGVVEQGGLIPLFMTIGRISTEPPRKYCAVLRDITHWKKSEEDLTAARRRAEEASVHKSDFLAKISHEIRTPLNAIIGFSEVMMDERFGPVGNDRYKDYLRDIHSSGSHIMSLINDLLDLSKVEAGKMDLRFEAVALGDIMAECVAMMQPQANRERIIIRSSLPAGVPAVVADPRSVRQVVLNLLSNAIKFTPSGGQVIVSTNLEDSGEVVMRVRDTGYGMTEKELQTAMEPFRQLHTTRSRGGGTGLGLPLTKALVEANRAVFRIDSTVGQGTLVTVTFPVTRVLAS